MNESLLFSDNHKMKVFSKKVERSPTIKIVYQNVQELSRKD